MLYECPVSVSGAEMGHNILSKGIKQVSSVFGIAGREQQPKMCVLSHPF